VIPRAFVRASTTKTTAFSIMIQTAAALGDAGCTSGRSICSWMLIVLPGRSAIRTAEQHERRMDRVSLLGSLLAAGAR
jgi:hypothetical protein